MTMQDIFMLLMAAVAVVGFYCAKKLDGTYVWWVRLLIMLPALTALFTLGQVWCCVYTAFEADILRAVSQLGAYAIIASRFSANPWLDIRINHSPAPPSLR